MSHASRHRDQHQREMRERHIHVWQLAREDLDHEAPIVERVACQHRVGEGRGEIDTGSRGHKQEQPSP